MIKKKFTFVVWLAASVFNLYSAEPTSSAVLEPESRVHLSGDSTLHAYSAVASQVDFSLSVSSPSNDLFEEIKAGNMTSLEVKIPASGLKSGSGGLDKNMHKALKAATDPDITFHLAEYAIQPSTSAAVFSLIAKGELTVAGETRSIDLEALVTAGTPLRIKGSEKLLMTDYGIKPPSVLGAIRARNEITVGFDLLLIKNPQN